MSAPEVRAHSAAHVLKGAVTKVLGPRRFTFVQAGVLKVTSEGLPAKQEVGKIEAAANRKIAEDAEILEFSMDRQEAEGHFGTGIYDIAPAPPAGTLLRIVRIPDWDASYCPQAHVESTGSIGAMRIDRASFDEAGRELELRFHLV
jgi:alanyl-tRNA synthetase